MFRSNERNVLTNNNIDNQVISHFQIIYKSKYLLLDVFWLNKQNRIS